MFLTTWVIISLLVGGTFLLRFLGEAQGTKLQLGGSDMLPLLTKLLAILSAVALVVSAFYVLVENMRHSTVAGLLAYPAALLYLAICVGLVLVLGVSVGLIKGEIRIDMLARRED
jgi:hypothetical protein